MEALKLSRKDYIEGKTHILNAGTETMSYLDQFVVEFPEGINTASTMEICRIMELATMETKEHLMRICIAKKNVKVTCPNGEVERFCMSNVDDNLEAFPLFQKEPLAMVAIADSIYGYILKKYVRLSKPKEAAAQNKAE